MFKKLFILFSLSLVLTSCSFSGQSVYKQFLNYRYVLNNAGDLHGLPATSNEVLGRNPGFTSYINLFDKENSYIDFQCYGNSFDSFYCETTFCLKDKNGNYVMGNENYKFRTSFDSRKQILLFEDKNIESQFGVVYANAVYSCRWQCEYDVKGDGNKVLLTFEFWKKALNPIPEWSENEY